MRKRGQRSCLLPIIWKISGCFVKEVLLSTKGRRFMRATISSIFIRSPKERVRTWTSINSFTRLAGSLASLFHREYEEKKAVKEVTFTIEPQCPGLSSAHQEIKLPDCAKGPPSAPFSSAQACSIGNMRRKRRSRKLRLRLKKGNLSV